MSYFKKRGQSFKYAVSGLIQALGKERNLQLQALLGIAVVMAAVYFRVNKNDWFILGLCCTLVISLELVNSAVEKLCDLVKPEQHSGIGYIKDVMAAAVLVMCIF